jgi:DNA-binding NarL/FixJ family response regulator
VDKIRVAVIDDQRIGRDILRSGLQQYQEIELVGEAGDGQGAINLARTIKIDVILMDINMPGTGGLEAAHIIKRESPSLSIIAMVNNVDEAFIKELIRAGMDAYMLKDDDIGKLVSLMHSILEGVSFFEEKDLRDHKAAQKWNAHWRRRHEEGEVLTSRELEILTLISSGGNNKDIAQKLNISEKTVKNHVSNIFRKLEVEDRTQAVIYAIKHQMVEIE